MNALDARKLDVAGGGRAGDKGNGMGGAARQACNALRDDADNLIAALGEGPQGGRPPTPINPEVLRA